MNQNIFEERFISYRLNFKASSSWQTVLAVLLRVGKSYGLNPITFQDLFKNCINLTHICSGGLLHELFHVFGIMHEQKRMDRDR